MLNEGVAQKILKKAMELWGFDAQANILEEERSMLNRTILKKALELWGFDAQANILEEECSEVIKAICKHRRFNVVRPQIPNLEPILINKICEEIADVKIVIAQFETDIYYKKEIDYWVAFKMRRLAVTISKFEKEQNAKKTTEGS